MVDFVTKTMGQAIVTSHSPYVIERFGLDDIVVLNRGDDGTLTGCPIDLGEDIKPKKYREQRRQFAEAVLANAVLVVEGGTEAATYLAVADVLDADPATLYQHPGVAGLAVFDAGGDSRVPLYGPVFAALGKTVFGAHDTPNTPFTEDQETKAKSFAIHFQVGYPGMEDLLIKEVSAGALRRFLAAAASRDDYPRHLGYLPPGAADEQVVALARKVLEARKATEYAPLVIAECHAADLPETLAKLMLDINAHLTAKTPAAAPGTGTQAGPAGDGAPDTAGDGGA